VVVVHTDEEVGSPHHLSAVYYKVVVEVGGD